jgi:hypothetical protein
MRPEDMGTARGNCGFLDVSTILSKDRARPRFDGTILRYPYAAMPGLRLSNGITSAGDSPAQNKPHDSITGLRRSKRSPRS